MVQHPVDIHVGRRLRSRRMLLGMSQESLGDAVGVTFQQIQKYEKGLNRIGSSRLYEFARILNVAIAYFFEDFSQEEQELANTQISALNEGNSTFEYEKLGNKEVLTLVRAYNDISDSVVRKRVLSLLKSLSAVDDSSIEKDAELDKKKNAAIPA